MAAAEAAAARSSSSSSSPCTTFIAESLILPTRNIRLFAPIFLLIFCHTFAFLAIAAIHVNPLAASLDTHALAAGVLLHPPDEDTTHNVLADSDDDDAIRGHAKRLAVVYVAYLVSRLAVQVVAVVAGRTTYSGDRLTFSELLLRWNSVKERISGPLVTAMFMGVLDLMTATILVVAARLTTTKILGGYLVFVVALGFYAHLSAVIPVSLAVSSAEGRVAAPALWMAWRLMTAKRKEAAVLTLIVCLVPAAVCPVYAIAASLSDNLMFSFYVWLMGIVFGFFLLPVALQLLSTAAATVFYYHCLESQVIVPRVPQKLPVDQLDAADHV
uniref:Uncharacterized protein n=1 Tax=Leersia perrieri TaxID=77586 RepID=A0A0D9XB77_9ORYZ